jgi:signal transduction histidine kinase/HAMP domain-containing protein
MVPAETAASHKIPDVGMRGGLGRTLLTAFLVLTILPLSIVSWYASSRSRLNIQEEVTEKLISIAALKEAQISRWIDDQEALLTALASSAQLEAAARAAEAGDRGATRSYLAAAAEAYGLSAVALLTNSGQANAASEPALEERAFSVQSFGQTELLVASEEPGGDLELILLYSLEETLGQNWHYLSAWPDSSRLTRILEETAGLGQTGVAYLVTPAGMALPQGIAVDSPIVAAALTGSVGEGLYENYAGEPVIGVRHWLPALGMALFVEQSQEEAFARNDTVTTAVIMAALMAALAAAIIAAFVTRHITRPIVQLTESTLHIASGDLSQRVRVASRDEIGILAFVFNRMTSDLEALYNDLEKKVAQRTHLLQQANYQIQRRAIQTQASVEVGQAITSILHPDRLLDEVVHLVRDRFVYSYVAVYTVSDKDDQFLTRRASAGWAMPFHGEWISADSGNLIGSAFRDGAPVVEVAPHPVLVGPPAQYTRFEAVLPLRMGSQTLGVLDVQSTEPEGFDSDDISILQNVAHQVTIALENARAYEVERKAAQRLREMDQFKRRFLTNMSHELRTPLTNVLGFSRLMLKQRDVSLSEQQREDLQIIHNNGQHLLGLINDLLDVSQIEAGLMELQFKEFNLADLIHSVMATASALVRDKDVVLREVVSPDLPSLQADPSRIRQTLLHLLANAAKFTDEGEIVVHAWSDNGNVLVSISDTGVGIAPEDQERIFERFEQGILENGRRPEGAGLGLALCKEFVEMHGGRIRLESEVGKGSTFVLSLPVRPQAPEQTTGDGA